MLGKELSAAAKDGSTHRILVFSETKKGVDEVGTSPPSWHPIPPGLAPPVGGWYTVPPVTADLSDSFAVCSVSLFPHACLQLTRRLRTDGFPALGLHGDKSQQERDWVLSEFKNGGCHRLYSTLPSVGHAHSQC